MCVYADSHGTCHVEALEGIVGLYQVEDEIWNSNLTGDTKQQYRVAHTKAEVESLFLWLQTEVEITALLLAHPFLPAATYDLKQELKLSVFLEYRDVFLDINHVERLLIIIPMGRKNWIWTEINATTLAWFRV